ncbi:MAG: hypothetical protein IPH45_06890 [Bacteroidales bacterium]|nr:hypothetical protein [Bacteroidales bacterium]
MKNFSQLWIVFIVVVMTTQASPQNYTVKTGLNLSSQHFKGIYQSYIDGIQWKPGFNGSNHYSYSDNQGSPLKQG